MFGEDANNKEAATPLEILEQRRNQVAYANAVGNEEDMLDQRSHRGEGDFKKQLSDAANRLDKLKEGISLQM